jgi:hypothetical protein
MRNNTRQGKKQFTIIYKGKKLEFTLDNLFIFNNPNSSITIDLYSNSIKEYKCGQIDVINRDGFFRRHFFKKINTSDKIKKIIWGGKEIFIINIYKKLYYSFSNNIIFIEQHKIKYGKNIYKYIDENCSICLEPLFKKYNMKFKKHKFSPLINDLNFIFNNKVVIKTLCKHYYHKNCINKWVKKKNNCPLCRITFNNHKYIPFDKPNNYNIIYYPYL